LQTCKIFWDVRKGLIPIVGAAREAGTSMLIEDVACPVDKLADMMIDLIDMFQRYNYHDASCFGHALEGNLHLVFSQVGGCVWIVMCVFGGEQARFVTGVACNIICAGGQPAPGA
jgi:hypothetical protein